MFPDNTYATLTFIDDEKNIGLLVQSVSFLIFVFIFCSSALAQWANNTVLNTQLVVNSLNPINIHVDRDSDDGFFLAWEDSKTEGNPEVYFLHVDKEGKASFRADGKTVSVSNGKKNNPILTSSIGNSAIIVWKDYSFNTAGELFCQKIDARGYLLWGDTGLRLTSENATDYSLVSDEQGNSYASFIYKTQDVGSESTVILQKISADGRLLFPGAGIKVYNSNNRKGMTSVVGDDSGGVFVFWTEMLNNKMIVHSQRVDVNGKLVFGKKPVIISAQNINVLKYSAYRTGEKKIYVVWQAHKAEIDLHHQLIAYNGRALWKGNGLPVSRRKSDLTNPQAYIGENEIYVTWTDEFKGSKDIFIQKYDLNGKEIWKRDGIPVTNINGDQFGQKISGDENGNVIVAWIDRRIDSLLGNVFVQKIITSGEFEWGENGLGAGTYTNSQKSYLSLISDNSGGAIVVFKDNREKSNNIYAQKIFYNGTFVSHISSYYSEITGDSIKLNWQSSNESEGTIYNIERTSLLEAEQTYWSIIGSIPAATGKKTNLYEFYDRPNDNGTLYYRIIQSGSGDFVQSSEVLRVDYFETATQVSLAQNLPNPFSDSTIISFYLPEERLVTFEFFDLRIEKVSENIKEKFPSGTNKVVFRATNLPSGIYFYRFKSGDFVEVKKMVIAK